MIVDRIEQFEKYRGLGGRVFQALQFLHGTDLSALKAGRHGLDGDDLFALVNDYRTRPLSGGLFEAHKLYIDVQYVVSGRELIGYAPLVGQVPNREYDEVNDYALYEEEGSYIRMEQGMFAVFMPEDLHMPGVDQVTGDVRKVVVKVRV